jgi:hypothetical protein
VTQKVDDNNSSPPTKVLTVKIRGDSIKKIDSALKALKDDQMVKEVIQIIEIFKGEASCKPFYEKKTKKSILSFFHSRLSSKKIQNSNILDHHLNIQ